MFATTKQTRSASCVSRWQRGNSRQRPLAMGCRRFSGRSLSAPVLYLQACSADSSRVRHALTEPRQTAVVCALGWTGSRTLPTQRSKRSSRVMGAGACPSVRGSASLCLEWIQVPQNPFWRVFLALRSNAMRSNHDCGYPEQVRALLRRQRHYTRDCARPRTYTPAQVSNLARARCLCQPAAE